MYVLIVQCGESAAVAKAVQAWAEQGIQSFVWDVKNGHRDTMLELHADAPERCSLVHRGERLNFSEVKAVWLATSNLPAIERPLSNPQKNSFYYGEWFFALETVFVLLNELAVHWINRPAGLSTHARDLRTLVASAGLDAQLNVGQLQLPGEDQWVDFSECSSSLSSAPSAPGVAVQTIDYVGSAYWVVSNRVGLPAPSPVLATQELLGLVRGHEQPVGRFEVVTFQDGSRELIGTSSFGELLFDDSKGLCVEGHAHLVNLLRQ